MNLRSKVPTGVDPTLGDVFPTQIPDCEGLVYSYVKAAADGELGAAGTLNFYGDNRPGQPAIPVVAGWPAYPGVVPAIGVAAGPDSEDGQHDTEGGGFLGDVIARDQAGQVIGTAAYFAEPLSSTVIVQLIHENRDERDRLHTELRRTLAPLRRYLPSVDPLIYSARIDSEKAETDGGPETEQLPFLIYLSIFTVTIAHEMRQPEQITDATGVLDRIDVTVEALSPSGLP